MHAPAYAARMQTRNAKLAAVVAFSIFCAGACAGSTASPATNDAGADTGGAPGADVAADASRACPAAATLITDAPACNTLVNNATAVPFAQGAGTPAVPAGGTIRDGLYEATRAEGYGGATPSGRRLTLAVLDGGTRFLFGGEVLDGAGTQVTLSFRVNANASVSGASVAFSTTCMSGASNPLPAALDFTASGDTLVMGLTSGTTTSVTTYTRKGCP